MWHNRIGQNGLRLIIRLFRDKFRLFVRHEFRQLGHWCHQYRARQLRIARNSKQPRIDGHRRHLS
jgi:hypothetical protein